ncbi:MAG: O-antigen ligase family protein [Tepidimonas sp.]|uniref:O-antigen ligase family protein n=1 Tax=Tepidimonas sp. TaxID=2002775 RepID=UPI004054F39E
MTSAASAQRGPVPSWLLAGAAFVLPAFSLALPSGYSWGALLLVLAGAWALATPPWWDWRAPNWGLAAFGAATAAMALVWMARVDVDWGLLHHRLSDFDRSAKYGLALLAIPAVSRAAPPAVWLQRGCWAGAWLAGLTAAWQVYGLGAQRAAGYTNAIQFGDIALLLALWSALWWRHARGAIERWWAAGAVGAGMYASLASGTRGGWFVAPALLLLVWWLQRKSGRAPRPRTADRRIRGAIAAVIVVVGGLLAHQWPTLETRLQQVRHEWTLFHEHGVTNNSIGHRLAHWELAWRLGLERPVLGWSEAGYRAEKQRRVQTGEAPAVVLQFGHAHHEWLDLWAKAGLLGIVALGLFYGVPLAIYVRALHHASTLPPGPERDVQQTVAACGLMLVAGFMGFGMTQVMFAHNSGNMVYLFMNLLWIGALRSRTATHDPRYPDPASRRP